VTASRRQRTADARADVLADLERILEEGGAAVDHRVVANVACGEQTLPVHVVCLGNRDPAVPAVGLFAGVHGLERIGTHVVVAFLRSVIRRLRWDDTLQRQLEALRLVFMPLVNPGGAMRGTRANPNGVDLMRNAPIEAVASVPWLVGGQRLSALLPWYRGPTGAAMEVESRARCDVVRAELIARPFSVALDCHSGFGAVDRIWFPFAHSTAPIAHLAEVHALAEIFEQSQPHHRYVFEPQSRQYLTHGDLWDHLYLVAAKQPASMFLPLTLELGSWLWVKKNPRQLFSRAGLFNPGLAHRHRRVLRSHMPWFEFLTRAAASSKRWLPEGEERERHARAALLRWYGASP